MYGKFFNGQQKHRAVKRVVCINDKNLPQGAEVVNGREYYVVDEFVNNFEQRVFIISGIANKGTTRLGLNWLGYCSTRFADLDDITIEYEWEAENNRVGIN